MKKTIRQKNKKFYYRNNFLKIISVFLAFLLWIGFSNVPVTYAYFTGSVDATGNTFSAGTLNINSSSSSLGNVDLGTTKDYSILNQGSLDFEYSLAANIGSGSDTAFCNQLSISVDNGSGNLYSGSLPSLSVSRSLAVGAQDDVTFKITDPSASGTGKNCNFNFVLKAWEPILDSAHGFTAHMTSSATVYSNNTPFSNGVVLNEFLPYPNGTKYGHDFGSDSSDMPQGEWVELYNNGSTAVDLSGWYIRDSLDTSTHKIMIDNDHTGFATPTISSHGFLVVYMNKALFNNNSGDSVRLFDNNNDNPVDSYSYTLTADFCNLKPTEGTTNNESGSGVGSGCTGSIPDNKSYARIPDGVGSWVDPIPTPDAPNKLTGNTIEAPVIAPKQTPEAPLDNNTGDNASTTTKKDPTPSLQATSSDVSTDSKIDTKTTDVNTTSDTSSNTGSESQTNTPTQTEAPTTPEVVDNSSSGQSESASTPAETIPVDAGSPKVSDPVVDTGSSN